MLLDGTDYKKIKKVVMINILDYVLYKEHEEYISKTAIVLDKHREHEVIKDLEWYFIELPKFQKLANLNLIDTNDFTNFWLAFINNDRRLIDMAVKKDQIFRDAKKELEYLTGDAETRRLQDLRDKWEMDRISANNYYKEQGKKIGEKHGEKRGEKRGKKLGEQGIIKTLFKNNMSVEEIAEKTGIKLAEVLKIINC